MGAAVTNFVGCGPGEAPKTGPPYWCDSLYIDPEMTAGLTAVSDGMAQESAYQVSRQRKANSITDAARWCKGMEAGKHVYAVVWPAKKNRGTHSCIGVATTDVPLKKDGKWSLVGAMSGGWCADISRRRTFHSDQQIAILRTPIPDRFYMYVDMDSGKIAFGEDLGTKGDGALYFGDLVTGITVPPPSPLHVMVSCLAYREHVIVEYKGTACQSGGFKLLDAVLPPPPVAAPPPTAPEDHQKGPPPAYDEKPGGSDEKKAEDPPEKEE